jgi:small subunit ribosomal protein S1
MANYGKKLVKELELSTETLEQELEIAFAEIGDLEEIYGNAGSDILPEQIVKGTVIRCSGDHVYIDIGAKSEGEVHLSEFEEPEEVAAGQEFEVLIESLDDGQGMIQVSKRKADRIRAWETVIDKYSEGDVVSGLVTRKIKGGLLVDIGVRVPARLAGQHSSHRGHR